MNRLSSCCNADHVYDPPRTGFEYENCGLSCVFLLGGASRAFCSKCHKLDEVCIIAVEQLHLRLAEFLCTLRDVGLTQLEWEFVGKVADLDNPEPLDERRQRLCEVLQYRAIYPKQFNNQTLFCVHSVVPASDPLRYEWKVGRIVCQ